MHARASARELIQVGSLLDDPRSTGLGVALLAWIALMSDSYAEALEYSERSLAVAVTPWDRNMATIGKGCALVLLGQTEEGAKLLEQDRHRCLIDGDLYALVGSDAIVGLCKIFQGRIREGIHIIEEAILRREKDGYRVAADWYRGFLAEVYLQVIAGEERLPLRVLLRNIPILLRTIFTASSRIQTLMIHVLDNPNFDPAGHQMGRAQMILGLLYKAKKKRALAVQHLTEAKRIFSQFGHTPVLARVETALAGLGQ